MRLSVSVIGLTIYPAIFPFVQALTQVMNRQSPADFEAIQRVLRVAEASWDAAEAHGACCGWACLAGANAIRAWSGELLGSIDINDSSARENQQQLFQLAADALLQLEQGDMEFALLLPPDEDALSDRVVCLAEWCQGFMHGLAAGGDAESDEVKKLFEAGEIREILDDFSQITRASVGGDAEEVSEQAYTELVEYIRMSAQLLYYETADMRKQLKDKA